MWQPISETVEAVSGQKYRTTYHVGGPYPPMWAAIGINEAVKALSRTTGKVKFLGGEFFDKYNGLGGPYGSWAYRVTWEKQGSGSPLVFFTGPGGLITLAIVGILIGVTGAVILARTVEHLVEEIPQALDWMPGLILGAVVIAGLYLTRKGGP